MATQMALAERDTNIAEATATYRSYVEGQVAPINATWQKLSTQERLAIIKKSGGLRAMIRMLRHFEKWLGVDRDTLLE